VVRSLIVIMTLGNRWGSGVNGLKFTSTNIGQGLLSFVRKYKTSAALDGRVSQLWGWF